MDSKHCEDTFMPIKKIDNKGKFIKSCPGTPKHVCCGYQIIDFAHGCTLGCTYCALNYYDNFDTPFVYQNLDKLYRELDDFIKKRKGIIRFGTGEFTDSLLFEKVFPIYEELIPFISSKRDAVLEIKTKTLNIKRILNIDVIE